MLTFLINLNQRPDRLAFMQAQLGPIGLGFQRISAVDGLGRLISAIRPITLA